jgi:hypothetical protein
MNDRIIPLADAPAPTGATEPEAASAQEPPVFAA